MLCSTCSSLTETQKISISTSSKQKKNNGVKVTGLQPGATSCGHPWLSQTRARHSRVPKCHPLTTSITPWEWERGNKSAPKGVTREWGSQRVKKPHRFCLVPQKRWDQQHGGKSRISQSSVGQDGPRAQSQQHQDQGWGCKGLSWGDPRDVPREVRGWGQPKWDLQEGNTQ